MKLKLPSVILAMLKKRGATIDDSLRGSKAQLEKTCSQHGYKISKSVLAFEAAFGGLLIPDEGKIKKNEPCWIFGTHACLTAGGHERPGKGKLVPVVYSPNDIIYYLDGKGQGYAEDTIEDESPSLYAQDGISLVCRIVLDDELFLRGETSVDLSGLQGEALAKIHSLHLIAEASDKDRRFFSDAKGSMLVAEDIKAKQTRVACITKKQLALVKKPGSSNNVKLPEEAASFIGKESVRIGSGQRTSLPDIFDKLPDLKELDLSSNRLAVLPASIWRAARLSKLDISFNPIEFLPDDIGSMRSLTSLLLRGCLIKTLPKAITNAKNLTKLIVTECEQLDVDATLPVIAMLSKLKELSLPLSESLTSIAPLAKLPLKSLVLSGARVKCPAKLPSGLGQLKKLTGLSIEYADDIAKLPDAKEDIDALRLLFSKKFSVDDIRRSIKSQPEVMYLQAYADTL